MGKWEAVKIGYSHVLHLREVASDCRTFGTCPADTLQVKGKGTKGNTLNTSNGLSTLSLRASYRGNIYESIVSTGSEMRRKEKNKQDK